MPYNNTIDYYNKNARQFIEGTVSVDFAAIQNLFLEKLEKGAHILDFGCGSGRDAKYFLEQGFRVTAIDGSAQLCKSAREYTGLPVKHMMFQELDEKEQYDGIWACSSILHLPYPELVSVFHRMIAALKDNGVLYASFKYGVFEGERNGRYFTDMTEDKFLRLLNQVGGLQIENQWINPDVRPGREKEKWLNIIMRKK